MNVVAWGSLFAAVVSSSNNTGNNTEGGQTLPDTDDLTVVSYIGSYIESSQPQGVIKNA